MLNGLDLFSGIGGLTVALSPWVKPVAYCEKERYAQSVLLSRMGDGSVPRAPIWDDIKTLRGESLNPLIDIVYGGFPCQDISVAGNGAGLAGERSGLFFEICRLVKEIKPAFIFLENVPAIRTRGLREVIRALTDLGYDCRWTRVSAQEVGANHKRERWFLLAHSNSTNIRNQQRRSRGKSGQREIESRHNGQKESVANSESFGLEEKHNEPCRGEPAKPIFRRSGLNYGSDWWSVEPNVGRVANGIPFRVDRLRGLGNAVVPPQAREAFERLMGLYG